MVDEPHISPKISACVMTLNEEANIVRCLSSLTWCDEIIVVDSGSTDRTVELCADFTDKVHFHEWGGYISQRNVCRDLATFEWVLFMDADEEVSEGLRTEIQQVFSKPLKHNGFQFPRMVFYLGKWIRHGEWYPDTKLRLFRKSKGITAGREPHDTVVVDGPVKTLSGRLLHYTYDSVQDHISTLNRFTTISAAEKHEHGRTFRYSDIYFRPLWRFFKGFILKLGFLDGTRGFMIASLSAFGVAMKYSKLRELQWRQEMKSGDKAAQRNAIEAETGVEAESTSL